MPCQHVNKIYEIFYKNREKKRTIRDILSELCEIAHNTKENFNASPLINEAEKEILDLVKEKKNERD